MIHGDGQPVGGFGSGRLFDNGTGASSSGVNSNPVPGLRRNVWRRDAMAVGSAADGIGSVSTSTSASIGAPGVLQALSSVVG